ncbi:hypothetical protein BGZ61DRAFT_526388 [Ilyonectria robusta]|uniref:uncharacterized protein n=1 Tax=Ilyonectria robusta TaxID=1079257 RepID=UPI001E8DF633|nr:uncharacterized protein BGZ61DRAFT_526388 [Ilyonectria robusta]KAH8738411.1 hypothetical protein BGZ61DRAFT_526388 [Ilyonectria robusta]
MISNFHVSILSFLLLATHGSSSPLCGNTIRWVNCSEHIPSSLNLTGVDLSDLPESLHCGRVDVPMDYSKPMSRHNMITLGLAMYRPENPKGVLFVNPGGTDPGVVLAWQAALNQTDMFSGLMDYDLMMLDVRGTYSSNPLNVSLDVFGSIPSAYPQNESDFKAYRQASRAMFQSWIDFSSPPGIAQFVGTREVVQDYEQIRQALGYDKINFLGASYGTYRACQYAFTFPDRVGHFALDAVVPHGRTLFDKAQDGIKALNRAVLRADAYCQKDENCPFHKEGRGSILRTFQRIIAGVQKAESSCKGDCSSVVSTAAVQASMSSLFQGQPDFGEIINTLSSAMVGNFTSLLSGSTISAELAVALPLECGDVVYNKYDYLDFKKSLEAGLAIDNSTIGMTQIWLLQLYCSGWPFHVSPEVEMPTPERMLLVTSDFDDDSPTEWTSFAWGQIPNAALVDRHGDGHVSFLDPGHHSTMITKEFLRTGKLPPAQDETLVSVYSPGTIRPPVSDPYLVPI